MKRSKNLILPRWNDVLISFLENIDNLTCLKLSRKLNMTSSNFYNYVNFLEKKGLLIKEKIGVRNKIKLTDKGELIAIKSQELKNLLEEIENG